MGLRFDKFLTWIVEALSCSFWVYFAAVNFATGSEVDIWLFGTTIFTLVFAIASARIIVDTAHWTLPTHVGVWGSIIVFMLYIIITSYAIVDGRLFGVGIHLFTEMG